MGCAGLSFAWMFLCVETQLGAIWYFIITAQTNEDSCIAGIRLQIYDSQMSRLVMSDSATPWTIAHQDTLSMGVLQARILEWVAMLSPRESPPRD